MLLNAFPSRFSTVNSEILMPESPFSRTSNKNVWMFEGVAFEPVLSQGVRYFPLTFILAFALAGSEYLTVMGISSPTWNSHVGTLIDSIFGASARENCAVILNLFP